MNNERDQRTIEAARALAARTGQSFNDALRTLIQTNPNLASTPINARQPTHWPSLSDGKF